VTAVTASGAIPLRALLFLFILMRMPSAAQVLEVNGGSSSLYQTQGGSILLHGPAYESEVGAGLISGRLVAGGHLAYRNKTSTYSAGIEEVRFDLPTDLFNGDHRLLGVGVAFQSVLPKTNLELFAGGTSQQLDTPLFSGVRADEPAAALILRHALTPSVSFTTQLLASSPGAALQAIQWKTKPWLSLAASGGFGGEAHYAAASVDVKRPLVDLKACYVDAGAGFHRIGSQFDMTPEPVHENLLFTVRSSRTPRLTISGGRQNFMVPADSVITPNGTTLPSLISTSDQISASTSLRAVEFTGSVIHSAYDSQSNLAIVLSAAAPLGQRAHLQSSFFQSRLLRESNPAQSLTQGLVQRTTPNTVAGPTTNSFVTNLQEVLTRRISANQTITYSNGQTSIGYGGSLLSNFLTLSADYETFYVPTRPGNPFQQTLVLDLQLNLFGRVTLHGGTFVSPTGRMLYTANLHAIESRTPTPAPPVEHARFGAYVLQGRVVDTTGAPIYGAAIGIGDNTLFTDSDGTFFMREPRPRSYPFKVLLDQFLDGHNYRVVSQPMQITTVRTEDQHFLIIVARTEAPAQPVSDDCGPAIGPHQDRRNPGTSASRANVQHRERPASPPDPHESADNRATSRRSACPARVSLPIP
jgi:hypothetical protein